MFRRARPLPLNLADRRHPRRGLVNLSSFYEYSEGDSTVLPRLSRLFHSFLAVYASHLLVLISTTPFFFLRSVRRRLLPCLAAPRLGGPHVDYSIRSFHHASFHFLLCSLSSHCASSQTYRPDSMSRSPAFAAAAALIWWWLGASLALADLIFTSDIEQYTSLAAEHKDFPIQRFRSSSIIAPVFHVNRWDRTLTDDEPYIFIGGNYNDVGGGAGPMIIDASDLSLIYRDPSFRNAYNSEVSLINGKRHLTFWAHSPELGHKYFVYDENYNRKYAVGAKHGYGVDMHELQVTNEGTAVFVAHRNVPRDLTRFGGPKDGRLLDTGIQEVDLETGDAIFTWSAADHLDIDDTFAEYVPGHYGINDELKGNWDFCHRNSARKV